MLRNLIALALLLVNFKHVHGSQYMSYQTETVCNAAYPIEFPTSIPQIQQIVTRAISLNTTVKAFGSRHSVLDTICTDGIPIDMHYFNGTTVDPVTGIAKVNAGTQLADFMAALQAAGRALNGSVPSFGGVTVGGALGTGARGSSLRYPTSLSDQIIAATLVDGTGAVRVVDESSADLAAIRVHLGLLGVVADVSFKTIPAFKMYVENYKDSDSVLLDGSALQMARDYDWFQIWWFPTTASVVISRGQFVSYDTPGNASTYNIPDLDAITTASLSLAFEEGQALRSQLVLGALELWSEKGMYQQIPLRQPVFSEDGGQTIKNPAVGYAQNLMQNRCTKCAWDYGSSSAYTAASAFALELGMFDSMVRSIKDVLSQYAAAFPCYGLFIRFAPASNALMSIENGRTTVHMEIVTPMRKDPFNKARAGLAAIQAIEMSLFNNLGGRPHRSMTGQAFHTKDVLLATSPGILQFRNYVTKYDPKGVFMNKFGRRVMGVSNELLVDPRATHCALQEYCFCSSNSDCANWQICAPINGFKTCKDFLPEVNPILNKVSDATLAFLASIAG